MSFDIGKTIQCNHIEYDGTSWADPSMRSGCPKCRGSGYLYDMEWHIADGSIAWVENLNLLEELIKKGILTILGDNKFHPDYGTSITKSIGTLNSTQAFSRVLEMEIEKACVYVYKNQQFLVSLGQSMTNDELIHSIRKVGAVLIDERTMRIDIDIITESGKDVAFSV